MKINHLLILPLVLLATAGSAQPQVVATFYEGIYVNSAVDLNGVLYYSEGNSLYIAHPEYGYADPLFSAPNGKAENLKNVNGTLYFTAHTQENQASLWKSDGTVENTVPVIQFSNTYNPISPLVNIGDIVYFGFQDKVYRSDGTGGGTESIKDLDASGDKGFLRLAVVESAIFVSYRRASGEYELWMSDGSVGGTKALKSFRQIEFLQSVGSVLYFVADDGSTGRELWEVTSGEMPTLVHDINPGSASSFKPDGNISAARHDALVFATITPAATWVVDTAPVQLARFSASEIASVDGQAYFLSANELWTTNGSPTGTRLVKMFADGNASKARLSNLTAIGETVFFALDGMQLWQSDGTATIRVYDHTPSTPEPAGTMDLIAVGDLIYYFGGVTGNNEWFDPLTLYVYNPSDVWIPSLQLVDATTDEDIGYLDNNTIINTDQAISIRADASLATSNVVFHISDVIQRREQSRPFSMTGDNNGNYNAWIPGAGTYQLTVTPYSSSDAKGSSSTYRIRVVDVAQACGSGIITREFWNNFSGNQITSVPFDRRPSGSESLNIFEGPTNAGTNYAARIKGYICPPETGHYTLWIASNDHSELWLSSDADPRNRVKIAHVIGATNPRQWDKFQSQKSAPIHLQSGTQYYVEAVHKQGAGTDNIAVGWQLPNGEMERPIPGNRLSSFTGNHPPDVRIVSPIEGQVFTAPATILIQAETPDQDGFVEKIEFFAGSKLLDEYNHQFEWTNVQVGAYEIYARATDNDGAVTISPSVNIVVTGPCSASGTIRREYWNGISGSKISDLRMTEPPSGEMELSLFEAPENAGTNYGARIRGFICPPSTGDYVFWIASNDQSELWLSADDDPASKERIAYVSAATNSRQWNKFSAQKSSSVPLVSGRKYYIEALHKQGVGSDHLAVGWQWPDGTMERPIAGSRLSTFAQDFDPVSFMAYPVPGTADIDPLVLKLKAEPVIGAKRYTIEISQREDFANPSKVLRSVEDYQTTFVAKDLEHATTYFVRVKTDISGFGPVKLFTTRDAIGIHRLWGLSTAGGKDDAGTIFSFSIDSAHFVKHYDREILRYEWGEGEGEYEEYVVPLRATPVAGPDGTLYGQSYHEFNGDVFAMSTDGDVSWLSPFLFIHEGDMMLASNNNLYITTAPYLIGGGIGRYDIDEPGMTANIREFNQKEHGLNPSATLIEVGEYLYGTTVGGGINDGGVVYRIRHDGTGFEIIHYFRDVLGGKTPVCGLTEAEGFIYGTTSSGGAAQNMGIVFRMRTDGSDFMKLHDFGGVDGRNPIGEVIVIDDVVFSMASRGGTADRGTIYRVNADGSDFAKLHDFKGIDGDNPSGALAHDAEGNLYGMTSQGGENNMGVIFTIHSNGTAFTKLFDFSPGSGGRPEGSLVIRDDTFAPVSAMARAMPETESVMEISIHPNPTTDNFNVHVKTPGGEKIQVVVTDQYGQMVASYEISNDIPAQVGSELKRGLYIIKIMQDKEIMMKRVVKK